MEITGGLVPPRDILMNPFQSNFHLALVSAGRQRLSILAALVPLRKDIEFLRVMEVAGPDPEAPGIVYASRRNFYRRPFHRSPQAFRLDTILTATGRGEVLGQLNKQRPEGFILLSVERVYSWKKFWDPIFMKLSFPQDAPMRLGIVGGGKAAREVSPLITEECRH